MTTKLLKYAWDLRHEDKGRRKPISLPVSLIEIAVEIGNGNMAKGMRIAIEEFLANFDISKAPYPIPPVLERHERAIFAGPLPYREVATQLGRGNMAAGIRLALSTYRGPLWDSSYRPPEVTQETWDQWVSTTTQQHSCIGIPASLRNASQRAAP